MKKVISIILIAMFVLASCAPSIEEVPEKKELTEAELLRSEGEYLDALGEVIPLEEVTADNWYKVRLTYPVNFVSESELELYQSQYEKVSVDENNRVTVVMSRKQYESLKENAIAGIEADFEASTSGELADILPNITDIQTDEFYENICVIINGDLKKEQITPYVYLLCKDVYRFKILMGNNTPTTIIVVDGETQAVYAEFNDKQLYEYENKAGEEDEA